MKSPVVVLHPSMVRTGIMNLSIHLIIALAGLAVLSLSARAQCTDHEQQKLVAGDWVADWRGNGSLSMSHDVVLMTAFDEDGGQGRAHVFRWNGIEWLEEQELTSRSDGACDHFGYSCSISGNLAVISSPYNDYGRDCPGYAMVFRHDGVQWVEEQRLSASDQQENDYFGESVEVDGNVVLVGARYEGSAYVFRHDGTQWLEEQKLAPSDGDARDFGSSVSVDGNLALIGAAENDPGAAYMFRFDGTQWLEEQKLTASDSTARHRFGHSVSLKGDLALIGAWDDAQAYHSGAAYVFRYDGSQWVEEQKLKASDPFTEQHFGWTVSVDDNLIVAGAGTLDASGTTLNGGAYVFRFDGIHWIEQMRLVPANGDGVGVTVALSGNVALVGLGSESRSGVLHPSAFAFSIARLALDTSAESAGPGDTLSMFTCGGVSDAPVILVAVDLNGGPSFLPVAIASFDASGRSSIADTVPPGLGGIAVGFQSIGFFFTGRIGASNRREVTFR